MTKHMLCPFYFRISEWTWGSSDYPLGSQRDAVSEGEARIRKCVDMQSNIPLDPKPLPDSFGNNLSR